MSRAPSTTPSRPSSSPPTGCRSCGRRRLDAEPRRARAGAVAAAAGDRRHVGRLDRRGRRRRRSPSSSTASASHPVMLSVVRGRGVLRGLLQRHAVAALPRRAARVHLRRRGSGTPTSTVNERFADTLAERRAARTPSSGSTTTTCSSCRRCCASSATTCGSASSSTSRSRPSSCSCGCRGAPRSPRACSAATWSASSGRSTPRTSSPVLRLRAQLDGASGPHRSAVVPDLDRRRGVRGPRRRAGHPPAHPTDPQPASASRRSILLGVDRLDYTKGIGHRLRAFERCSTTARSIPSATCSCRWPRRPARASSTTRTSATRSSSSSVRSTACTAGSAIRSSTTCTGRCRSTSWCALYRAGDVMLVTPFRDGMNLVAKEFVATRLDDDGVLVLSEFAGAADELTDAVLVNPHDERPCEDAIMTAVEMHRHERRATDGRDCARSVRRQRRAGLGRAIPRRADSGCGLDATRRARQTAAERIDVDGAVDDFDDRVVAAIGGRARRGRCSSASTSTACWRRSSRTPTTPSCSRRARGASPRWPRSHPGRDRVGPIVEDLGTVRLPRPRRDRSAATGSSAAASAPVELDDARARPARHAGASSPPRRRLTAGDGAWVESSRRAWCCTCARRSPTSGGVGWPTLLRGGPPTSTGRPRQDRPRRRRVAGPDDEQGDGDGELRAELVARHVVFVGDDLTDEEVFAGLGADDCRSGSARRPDTRRLAYRLARPPTPRLRHDAHGSAEPTL